MKLKDNILQFLKGKRLWQITLVFFGVVVVTLFMSWFTYVFSNHKEKPIDYADNNIRIFGLNITKNLNFAGESVPQNDFSIKDLVNIK